MNEMAGPIADALENTGPSIYKIMLRQTWTLSYFSQMRLLSE